MNTALMYLALVTAFTGILWVPYIVNRISVRGLADAVSYPANPKPHSPWAQRLICAHANAVENLVVFAPLVLLAHVTGVAGTAVGTAAGVYFWARVVHAVSYTFAIPWVRTLSFAVAFFAQATIAGYVLAASAA